MANYQPRQYLNWSYDQTVGELKIVSTIDMEVNTAVDKLVADECSGLVNDEIIVIMLTVSEGSPHMSGPYTNEVEILVEDIGTNRNQSYVEAKILALEPIYVQVNCMKSGYRLDSIVGSATKDTKLSYT